MGARDINNRSSVGLHVKNTSDDIISITKSDFAFKIKLKKDGKEVRQTGIIYFKHLPYVVPDEFAVLTPGQSRQIPVPVYFQDDEVHTWNAVYKLEKNFIYDIEITLEPYFIRFTKDKAESVLTKLKITNYLSKSIKTNSLLIRIKPLFK